jgi:histidinol-phosphatase (PHP family)
MDIVKRYGFDRYGHYDVRRYEGEVRAVLRRCAARGIALEVNTSTLRRPVGQSAPTRIVLKWFREEGGRWVTLGSDAHRPEYLAFGLEGALAAAQAVGFDRLARFQSRRPEPMPLDVAPEAK